MAVPRGMSWDDQRRPYLWVTCANPACGEEFVARSTCVKYCSPNCGARARSQAYWVRHRGLVLARHRAAARARGVVARRRAS